MMSLLLFVTLNASFAENPLSPLVRSIETVFPANREVIETCIDKFKSPSNSIGCIQSFKYMYGLCELTHEHDFDRRYNKISNKYFNVACDLTGRSGHKIPLFFEQDQNACVKGFETLRDRLETLEASRDMMEELLQGKYAYMLEKSSCKDFRKYINFCSYVDGDLKAADPGNFSLMPSVNGHLTDSCQPANPRSEVIYDIDLSIKKSGSQTEQLIFQKVIRKFKNRMPAGKHTKSEECENLRASYRYFNCAKFEKYSDGEPIWVEEEDLQKSLKERNKVINKFNSGGSVMHNN